jgi:peptidoglycan/LPS O-acetylase OafA/YrhL
VRTPGLVTGYRPWLDGVRAAAISMVVLQHTGGQMPLDLGFVGVGVFFGLSGYLITSLLLDEQARRGSVSLAGFYLRRAARLLPALVLVVLVCDLLFAIQADYEPITGSLASLSYTANYAQVLNSDWVPGFGPTWSLAIEEHFYLVWPLVVFSFSRPVLQRICIGVIVAGLALRLLLVALGMSELSVSVLTPCRIDTLIVGGLLAILVRREGLGARLLDRAGFLLLGLLGAVLAISLFGVLTGLWLPVLHQVRGSLFALFFGALTLASLGGSSGGGRLGRLFQGRILGFFGKYSYGLYVYHGLFTWYLLEVQANERLDRWFGGQHWLTLLARVVLGVGVSVVV